MSKALDIAFFGSSLVSAYWNGAATYYRGIVRALAARGHRVTFYEPDAYCRQAHRDIDEVGPGKGRIDRGLRGDTGTRRGFLGKKTSRRTIYAPAADLVAAEKNRSDRTPVASGGEADIFKIGA